jgi:hypothetical protein
MRNFYFQIFLFILGVVIGIAVPLFPRSDQKWVAGILAGLLVAMLLMWTGYGLAIRELTPTVIGDITPDPSTFVPPNTPPNSSTASRTTPVMSAPSATAMNLAVISSTTAISPIGVIGYTTLFTITTVVYTYPLPVPLYAPPSLDRIVIQKNKHVVVWPFDPAIPIYVNGKPVSKATRMMGTFVITAPYAGSGGIATLTPSESVSVTVESFLGVVSLPDEIPATGGVSNEVLAILMMIVGLALSILIWRRWPKFHSTRH